MLDELAAQVRARGGRPHILNDNPMFDVASALAYLETTLEMLEQLEPQGVRPTVFYMSSSGKGQAGLVLAQAADGGRLHACTASPRRASSTSRHAPPRSRTRPRPRSASTSVVTEDDIVNFGGFVGRGYGIPSGGRQASRHASSRAPRA